MKKSLYFLFGLLLVCGIYQACAPEDLPGSIYGTVVDKATGEPIKSAGVELSPSGLKTVTGSEGQFEFTELDPGKYTLLVTKTGYMDGVSHTIEVKPGQQAKGDVQIEQIPPALKVVDENNEDLLELHFGDAEADVARSFNIYNDGAEKLSWEIVKTAVWIDSLSKSNGELAPNGKQAVVVVINRNKLEEGENKTTLQITSSNGSKSLTILATNNRKAIVLNTLECTDVKGTTAVFNAEMLNEGNPKYTERGFVYSTQQQPMVENSIVKLTAPVNNELQFSAQAVDLTANTTYYVRAYAINALGTVYSTNQVSFVVQTAAPSVVTDAIKDLNIENGTAIFNGQVTYVGDPAYTERGFVYGIVPNPTIDDTKKIVSGNGEGAFSANITGLKEGNTYYVRAYAQNVKGVAYGKDVVVNCVATMPEVTTNEVTNISIKNGTATFVGDVKSYGDLSCEERGFVYALTNNPTIDDTKLTVSGAELGVFRKNVSGLEEGHTYYVRAYVTNRKGTVYGNEVSCNLTANMPVVKTLTVTNKDIANGVATFNGTVVSLGDLGYTEKGFAYGVAHNPTIDNSKVTSSGEGIGDFFATASELVEGKTYYIRAYVTNSKGTVYGEEVEMDYTAGMPEVKTIEVTNKNIGAGTATFKGSILSLGDLGYTERGFAYATVHNPTIGDSKIKAEGSGTGEFSATATQLEEGKVYYIRAYATNTKGTVYGEEIEMDYTAVMPIVKTVSIVNKNIASGTATFKGNVVSLGDLPYSERGFVYGIAHNPTIDDSKITASGNGTGDFTASASELAEGKTYYVRAFVTNQKGTVYGEEIAMDYTAGKTVVQTLEIISKNFVAGTATFKGSIISVSELGYSERGFVYSTVHNPTISDTKAIAEGSGSGEFSATGSQLTEGRIYYVRAYATNIKETVYGEEIEMDYTAVMPIVKTVSIVNKNIASGTATFKGNVVSLGDLPYSERGFVYGIAHNPTIDDSKITASGNGTGDFTASASELAEGKTYYVRAFVTNQKGTIYGEEIAMDYTAGKTVVQTLEIISKNFVAGTATFKGSIISVSELGYSERGFVYSTVHNPTISDTKAIAEGSGSGEFSATGSQLTEGRIYYVRAYATNIKETVYGEEIEMDYTAIMPIVKTISIVNKNIASGTATFKGNVVSLGDLPYSERGFVYGIAHNPTIDDSKITASGSGTGDFTASASELAEGKTYYVRAFVTNKKGTVYGEELMLDYIASKNIVKTLEVTNKNIATGTATFRGNIISISDLGYTERGFTYANIHNPTISDNKLVVDGNGTGEYSVNATQLEEGKIYYVRAYVTNIKETVYGEEVEMNYIATMPVVQTTGIINKSIANGIACLKGNVISLGELNCTERGFVYALAEDPTINDSKVIAAGVGLGEYTANITDLGVGNIYYVRAYVKNNKGVVYGENIKLDFSPIVYAPTTKNVTNISTVYAELNAEIMDIGDPAFVEKGFVYSNLIRPQIENAQKLSVSGIAVGGYSAIIGNLEEGATYYVNSYVTYPSGTLYGQELSFVTLINGSGVVLTNNNIPISGASVKISGNKISQTITTDINGKFTIEGVSPTDPYEFTITADGYQTYKASSVYFTKENKQKTFQLEELGKLTGIVKDQIGTLLKNVTVTLGNNNKCTTDQNGNFTFSNINPGRYSIKATKSNYSDYSQTIDVQPGLNEIELRIDPKSEITISNSWIDISCWPESMGTTTTTFQIKNNRDCVVQYDLSNIPAKGLSISPKSGSIQPNSNTTITVTVTYPTDRNGANVHQTTPQIIGGIKYYKTYLWPWEEIGLYNDGVTYYCRQNIHLNWTPKVSTTNLLITINLSQYTIYSD